MNHANKMTRLIFVSLLEQTNVNAKRCSKVAQPK